jgi:hypothetical protein
MISKTVFLARLHRFVTPALVAALGFGVSLTASDQAAAQAGGPPGMLSWSAGGVKAAGQASASAPNRMPGALLSPSAALAGTELKPASSLNQSLKMHGHWIIDIKNPDGTLAHHHEFENSIQYDGQNYLIGLMSGYGAAGPWEIYFTNVGATSAGSPCNTGTYPYCAIVYSTTTMPGQFACSLYTCAGGLTITPTFGVGPTLKLEGSITATQARTIGFVGTGMNACGQTGVAFGSYPTAISTVSPATCYTSPYGGPTNDFGGTGTSTTLGSPISVASGQIMQVTVILSFS